MRNISIINRQRRVKVDKRLFKKAIAAILDGEGIAEAEINAAIVDDPSLAALHDEYLGDPSATDVMSFPFERTKDYVEGEIVASADMAANVAERFGWTAENELLLYVIHGTLHVVGYDDVSPELRKTMRKAETKYLAAVGIERAKKKR